MKDGFFFFYAPHLKMLALAFCCLDSEIYARGVLMMPSVSGTVMRVVSHSPAFDQWEKSSKLTLSDLTCTLDSAVKLNLIT